ncbi:MAG TPA: ectonucleotide pyrophosphatase/phosphodiesterase [Polyangiaceae bacterium]
MAHPASVVALFLFTLAIASAGCAPSAHSPAPCGAPHAEPPGPIHHVVLITVDGMLPEAYLHPDAHGLKIPTLRRLVAQGAASDGALSVFPSVTYPSHTSMVTGVVPGKHGIVSNRSFDPLEDDQEGWRWYAEDIRRDPIWRIAQRAGYAVATVHWPVTVGADVTWRVPEYWRAKNDNDKKLLRALSTPGLLESVGQEHADFWPRFVPPASHDETLADIATHILETGEPNLLLLHLIEVDANQHKHGVWSPEAVAAIEKDDQQIARVLDLLEKRGLTKDTSVIVASDHGFMNAAKMVKPGVLLREAGLVTVDVGGHVTDWKATVLSNSGQAYVYVRDGADTATKEKVRSLYAAKAHEADSGIGRVYEASEVQALGGDPAAFLAIEAAPGFQLGSGVNGDYVAPGIYQATHGYDPNRPEMHASLILAGPNVPHGTIPDAHLIDIAPTIAGWLGLSIPDVDGHPLRVVPAH